MAVNIPIKKLIENIYFSDFLSKFCVWSTRLNLERINHPYTGLFIN